MKRLALLVLVAVAATPAVGSPPGKQQGGTPPPSSYAPRPHSGPHVYGSPIETPGHAATGTHARRAAKKPAADRARRPTPN